MDKGRFIYKYGEGAMKMFGGGLKLWVCGFGGVEKLVRSGGRRIWLKN